MIEGPRGDCPFASLASPSLGAGPVLQVHPNVYIYKYIPLHTSEQTHENFDVIYQINDFKLIYLPPT